MKRHSALWIAIALVAMIVLSSCAPAVAPVPTQAPAAPTAEPPTAAPVQPTAAPATPVPPTATPIPATATPVATAVTPAAAADFPITVTDALGRKVTIEQAPQRLVSMAPSLTEVLFAVGAGEQVVGVTSYCDYPEEAKTREQIGGFSSDQISVEKIVAMKPDLVFGSDKIHAPTIEALDKLGIKVVGLEPATLDELYTEIELIGRLTGHADEAAKVVAGMKGRIGAVQDKVSQVPQDQKLKVYWEIWDEPLMSAGPKTYVGQLIELAGGVNIFADVQDDWPQVSAEEIIKRNPQVIMGPAVADMGNLSLEAVSKRPGWSDIQAVKDQRVHLIDGNIVSRAGPRLADATELVAKALYPDLFK